VQPPFSWLQGFAAANKNRVPGGNRKNHFGCEKRQKDSD
jgi:hypothetical protein